MFKVTLAFLLFETLVATVQGADQCCPDIEDSLKDIKSDVEALQEELTDLYRKLNEEFNWSPPESGSCPDGFVYLPLAKSCYSVVYENHTWASAYKRCRQLHDGAHLAAITSQDESNALRTFLSLHFATNPESVVCETPKTEFRDEGKELWVGGQRLDKNSCADPFVWKLSKDEQLPFAFKDWSGNQPDCWKNIEQCVHLSSARNYHWNDVPCNFGMCALCEYQPA